MRIFISGQKMFGAAVYEMARVAHEIVGVAAPAFRDRDDEKPDRLRAAAERDGVRWTHSVAMRSDVIPDGTDLIISAHSHAFVSMPALRRTRLGGFGYHPSLLPLHRGRDAVRWTIKMGDRVAGGSVYWLTGNIDGGPIAAQRHVFVRPRDTAEELWRRELFPLGLRLIHETLRDLSNGVIVAVPQDEALATWEPSIDRAPLFRPDLPMIGAAPAGFRVVASREDV